MMGSLFVNGSIILGMGWVLFEVMDYIATLTISKKSCKLIVKIAVFLTLTASTGIGWLGAKVTFTSDIASEASVELIKTANAYPMERGISIKASQ